MIGVSLEPEVNAIFDRSCQSLPHRSMTGKAVSIHLVQAAGAYSAMAPNAKKRMTHFMYQSLQAILHGLRPGGRGTHDVDSMPLSSDVTALFRPSNFAIRPFECIDPSNATNIP